MDDANPTDRALQGDRLMVLLGPETLSTDIVSINPYLRGQALE